MGPSSTGITVIFTVMIANIVATNGRSPLEYPMEVAIVWDNIKPTTAIHGSYRLYYTVIVEKFSNFFRIGERNTRMAIIEFDHASSYIRLNLTTNPQLPNSSISGGRSSSNTVRLGAALRDVKSNIFVQPRPEALKMIFVILASGKRLDNEAESMARQLRMEDIFICATVFHDEDEDIDQLYNIVVIQSDVHENSWSSLNYTRSNTEELADQALGWLTDRINWHRSLKMHQSYTPGKMASTARNAELKLYGLKPDRVHGQGPPPSESSDGLSVGIAVGIGVLAFVVAFPIVWVIVAEEVRRRRDPREENVQQEEEEEQVQVQGREQFDTRRTIDLDLPPRTDAQQAEVETYFDQLVAIQLQQNH